MKVRELEEKYNYRLDYGDREVVEDWTKDKVTRIPPRRKRIKSIIKNRVAPYIEVCYGLLLRIKSWLLNEM